MTHFLPGLLMGLALIVAIGAQNAYVLRVGLTRRHVGVVVAICAISDLVLVAAGVAGVGALVQDHPTLVTVVTWLGAAYLVWFGVHALLRARRPEALDPAGAPVVALRTVATTALALTWLNPHVYLDTVLMLGSVAASHGEHRWWFGAGAMTASVLWFTALGFGARSLGRLAARPQTWRVLDLVIGVTMIALAIKLVAG
ncbi:LysE/ArgO family amino acid transporter [Agilicoccus flavus]|uniref:LysE/ArgO family amino acid transporter n=1 Tax=Agilicoccus flavus TaxID=2775968 RepID=UPI001CF65851|nr:LysE/ArgO family amino acid transporter [Agilicoccus flavus]